MTSLAKLELVDDIIFSGRTASVFKAEHEAKGQTIDDQ